MKKYVAAAVQFNPILGNKDDNVACLVRLCEEAGAAGARLIVLPEMATTGYCFYNREEIECHVEPVPGKTTELFSDLATRLSCYIVLGMAEVDTTNGNFYNTCVLVGPEGFVGKYRKTHLFTSDTRWAKEGDLGFPVFDTEIGKIACLICMDYYFFEPARILALKGAQILCNPTNWSMEKCPAPSWLSRSWENGLYVIAANRSDQERGIQFSGGSAVIKPNGMVHSYVDSGAGIVYGEIDLGPAVDEPRYDLPALSPRKPQFYKSLNLDLYHGNPFSVFRLYDHQVLPDGKQSVVSAYQFYPQWFEIEKNLKKIEEGVVAASREGSELLVLPEYALTGSVSSRAQAERAGEEFHNSPSIANLTVMAAKYGVHLLLGMVEKTSSNLFATIVMINKDGVLGKYRKVHLSQSDREWASTGLEGFQYVDLPMGRVGLLSGDDCAFPEATMSLAVWGVDVIGVSAAISAPEPIPMQETLVPLSPTITCTEHDPIHWHLWRARAVETNTYIVFANQPVGTGMGYSGIFGPTDYPRNEIVANKEETLLHFRIDTSGKSKDFPDKMVRIKENVRGRLPRMYDSLVFDQEQ